MQLKSTILLYYQTLSWILSEIPEFTTHSVFVVAQNRILFVCMLLNDNIVSI